MRSPSVLAGNQRSETAPIPFEFSTYRADAFALASGEDGLSTAESVLERSLSEDGGGGISHQSRIAAKLEEEQKKRCVLSLTPTLTTCESAQNDGADGLGI